MTKVALPPVLIDGFFLSAKTVRDVARGVDGRYPEVQIAPVALERCAQVRSSLERRWLDSSPAGHPPGPIYGFNTGVGALKDRQVSSVRLAEFQDHYIRSHCVGVGDPFPTDTVRAAILVRANSLASGHSGVRADVLGALVALLNRRLHPVVPRIGSLGASGDLAPLAHVGAVLTGVESARVEFEGTTYRVEGLPARAGLQPLPLAPKEAMALTNGTSFMLADLTLLLEDARHAMKLADICAAVSLEAMLGETDAFDARLQAIRGHRGQVVTARNLRRLLRHGESTGEGLRLEYLGRKVAIEVAQDELRARESGIEPEALRRYRVAAEHAPRVQDAYSLRCVPQVHGASRGALAHVTEVVEQELNAVTDNPLIFVEGDGYRALSGGNFHGQPLALAADYACIALAEVGSISERRFFRLLNSNLSYGLPSNLTGGEPGINTGLMIAQYTAAALVTENKTLCHPASVDSIPTSGDQEDHVSMGMWACRKARQVMENVMHVLAMELLAAVQGIELQERMLGRPRQLGDGTRAAFRAVRESGVAFLDEDRYLESDLVRMHDLVTKGDIVERVQGVLSEALD